MITGGGNMGGKYTESQKRAILKYQESKSYIKVTVTPEQKEKYKKIAESKGLSLTQFIVKLLESGV